MRSRLVRRSAQLIADFVIASLLPDQQTAMAFATNHSIQVDVVGGMGSWGHRHRGSSLAVWDSRTIRRVVCHGSLLRLDGCGCRRGGQ
jgi:hypothetical protein